MRLRPRIAGLAVILFVSACAAAFAATPYHLTDLGTISGFPDLTPMSVNVVGGNVQIVGIAQTSDYTDADACVLDRVDRHGESSDPTELCLGVCRFGGRLR